MESHGQETKDRIDAGGNGYGDRQHIIDQQCTPGDNTRPFAEGVSGHHIPAASGGKMLDDSRIGIGNDEYG